MATLKKLWGILRQINSCWLGGVVTAGFILAQVLLTIYPAPLGAWYPPEWFLLTFFLLGLMAPVGLVLAIRDWIWGHPLVALLGVILSCWPGVMLAAYLGPW